VIEEAIEQDKPDAILTLDYDTVFSKRDASMLMQLMCCHPEADAIAAMQSGRGKDLPLFTIRATDGANASHHRGGRIRAGPYEGLDRAFRPDADANREVQGAAKAVVSGCAGAGSDLGRRSPRRRYFVLG
jgi:hypothetical protein